MSYCDGCANAQNCTSKKWNDEKGNVILWCGRKSASDAKGYK